MRARYIFRCMIVLTIISIFLAACQPAAETQPTVEPPSEAETQAPQATQAAMSETEAATEAPETTKSMEAIPVRVAWQPYNSVLFYTANGLDLWSECGLDPEMSKFTAGPPQFAAIASDSVDLSLFGTAGMVFGLAQDLDLVNFYIQIQSSYSDGLVINPEAGIATVEDLAGKNVAYRRGSSAHLGLVRLLEDHGMTPDQLNLLDMEVPNLVPAFINGDIDAAYSWEPWLSKMEEEGGEVIARTSDVGLYTSDHWAARRAWAEDNPEAMRRVFCVIDKAYAAYTEDPTIGYNAFAEETGITPELAEKIMSITPVVSIDMAADPDFELSFTSPDGAQKMIQEVIDFLYEDQELIPTQPDAGKVVDGSYIQDYLMHRSEYVE
jgi:ABC-type nitrate/sulfonate/bicarbonate transport system substrate-binding protein